VPVIPGLVPATNALAVPAGWQQVVTGLHLRPGASVLALPVDPLRAGRANAMEWQAVTGEQISLIGGYCIVPAADGSATVCESAETLTYPQHATLTATYQLAWGKHGAVGPTRAMLAVAIKAWQPTAIVVVTGRHRGLARYLVGALGPPAIRQGSVLGWRVGPLMPLLSSYSTCAKLQQYPWSPCGTPPVRNGSHLLGS
jgi:hypothetical protein